MEDYTPPAIVTSTATETVVQAPRADSSFDNVIVTRTPKEAMQAGMELGRWNQLQRVESPHEAPKAYKHVHTLELYGTAIVGTPRAFVGKKCRTCDYSVTIDLGPADDMRRLYVKLKENHETTTKS